MSYATAGTSSDLNREPTGSLIAASKVDGTKVYNNAGEALGSVYDVMVEKRTGQVSYAVLSFGGFLGLGEKYHPVPWKQLTYSETLGGYVVNLDKSRLEGAPSYGSEKSPDWSSRSFVDRIDDFFGHDTSMK